jgi:CheY-like chemotaxis protein
MDTELLKRKLRVLHLEDNENDHLLVAETLRADGMQCEFTLVKSKDEFTEALHRDKYDLIISDFSLPSYDGLTALSMAQKSQMETPFVFFSGTIGEDVAVDSLKHGAVDYVLMALRKIRPDIKIIVASGSEKEVGKELKDIKTEGFIPKPFTTENLLVVAHEVLAKK